MWQSVIMIGSFMRLPNYGAGTNADGVVMREERIAVGHLDLC